MTGLSPNTGPAIGGTSIIITGTGFIGATAVQFGGIAATSFTVNSATQITATAPAGTGVVDVTVTIPLGGLRHGKCGPIHLCRRPNGDRLESVHQPRCGGASVIITGTGFIGTAAVQFGSTAATSFTVNSSTQITATAPAGTGIVDVTVTIPGDSPRLHRARISSPMSPLRSSRVSVRTPALPPAAPASSSPAPASPAAHGSTLRWNVGGQLHRQLVHADHGNFPSRHCGAVDVTVTIPVGGALGHLQRGSVHLRSGRDRPQPEHGPATGGASVVITGTGFIGTTAVQFGGTAATNFTINSSTQITATAPAGTGVVDVTVTIPVGGTSAISSSDDFTYVPAPAVTGVSPSAGYSIGGAIVTITGTNLTGATAVHFGSVAATNYTINSPTQITATAPAGSVGTVDVTVTTVGGISATSSNDDFTYIVSPPTVTAISPYFGSTSGGNSVTITGTNLTGATAVHFGGVAATSYTVNSATHITATAPAGAAGLVDVTVTTAGGTSATSVSDDYVYVVPGGFLVTNASNNPATSGSLPWAVAQANAASSNATITFDPADFTSATTITLASTLTLTNTAHSITINGGGAGPITVSGGGTVQDFNVNANVTAIIQNLAITGGYGSNGGGIGNAGTLTINNCNINGNLASGSGGGINNSATITVASSTISGNIADSSAGGSGGAGGGIFNSGSPRSPTPKSSITKLRTEKAAASKMPCWPPLLPPLMIARSMEIPPVCSAAASTMPLEACPSLTARRLQRTP